MKFLFVFLLFGCLFFGNTSCQKEAQGRSENVTEDSTGTSTGDSVSVLTFTGGGGFLYSIDTLPIKLFTVTSGPATGPIKDDTTYIFYNSERKVNRLMTVGKNNSTFSEEFKRYHLTIFEQGRIAKIYTKRTVYEYEPEFYDPLYGLSIGPLDPYTNIFSYDSLVYDIRGRLKRNYHYRNENAPGGGYRFYLANYEELDYFNPFTNTDSLLYSVKLIGVSGSPSTEIYFKEYELNKVNPLFKTFKELALFNNVGHIRKYYVPQYTVTHGIDRYITLNPYPLKKLYASTVNPGLTWQDYNLANTFDLYGSLLSSSYTSIYSTGNLLGYNYLRKKK